MEKKYLGEAIRELRSKKNMTQELLSGLAGVDRSHLSKVELGKRSPTVDMICNIASPLGVCASDILLLAESKERAGKLK